MSTTRRLTNDNAGTHWGELAACNKKGTIRQASRRVALIAALVLAAVAALVSPALSAEPGTHTYTTPDGWTHTKGLADRVPSIPLAAPSTEGLEPPVVPPAQAQDQLGTYSLGGQVHNWEGKTSTNGWKFMGWFKSPGTACDTAHNTTVREVLGVDVSKVKVSLRNVCNDGGDLHGIFGEYSHWTQAGYHFCSWDHAYHYYTTHYWRSLDKHLEAYVISAKGEFGVGLPGGLNSCNAGDFGRAEITSEMWVTAWPTGSWVGFWISRDIDNF